MKKLHPTTQYKKDLKRYRNNPQKLANLKEVLEMLQLELPSPLFISRIRLAGNTKAAWNATSMATSC